MSSGGGSLLGISVLELRTNQGPLNKGLAQAQVSTNRAGSQMQATMDKRMVSMGQSMSRVGSSMTRSLTVPILGVIGAAADLGAKFQASMEQIHTQAGASQKEVGNLTGKVLALAKASSSFTPQQLAEGLYHLESIGLRGSKAMDALKVAMKGAAIGQTDLESTATALGSVWIANIKGGGDLNRIMGSLNATVGAGNVRMQDLVLALGTGIVPAAKLAGLSLQDVEGALAVLTDQGTPASSAAAQLATALHFLYAPTSKADTALKSIGLSSTSMATAMHKPQGLLTALTLLKTGLDKIGGPQSVKAEQVLSAIFPAGRGRVLQTLLNNLDRYQGKLTSITKNSGNLSKDFAATQKTASYQLHQAWASIESDLIGFGQKVLPDILNRAKDVAGFVGTVVNDFTKLPKGLQDAIITGGLVVAAAGPALKILGAFTTGVGKLATTAASVGKWALGLKGLGDVGKITSSVATMEVAEMNVANMVGGVGAGGAASGAATAGEGAAGGAAAAEGGTAAAAGVGTAELIGMGLLSGTAVAAGIAMTALILYKMGITPANVARVVSNANLNQFHGNITGDFGFPAAVVPVKLVQPDTLTQALKDIAASSRGHGSLAAPQNPQATAHGQASDVGSALGSALGTGLARDANMASAALAKLETHRTGVKQTAAALSALAAQAHKLGDVSWTFADKFGAEMLKTHSIASKGVKQIVSSLDTLKPAAAQSAAQAMISMSNQLEATGKVPLGTTVKLVEEMGLQYGSLRDLSSHQMQQLASNIGSTMDKLRSKIATSTGQQRAAAVAQYDKMQSQVITALNGLGAQIGVKFNSIKGIVTHQSALTAIEGNKNFARFADGVYSYINSGALNAGAGANMIIKNLNAALHQLGQTPLAPIQVQGIQAAALTSSGATGPSGGPYAGTSFAQGGMVQVGRPGEAGRDTVPMSMGGMNIVVANGEVPMVATRHQYPQMDAWARKEGYRGGLPEFFRRNDKPNYMARGGLLPGSLSRPSAGTGGGQVIDDHPGDMTQGQEPQILQDLYELSARTATTVEVISGYRTPAHSVAVGGFADDPHTRGDAADIGPSSLMYRSDIDSLLAAANASGHGLYRPFYPASPGEYDHVQLMGVPLGPIIGQPGTGGGYSPVPGGAGAVAAKLFNALTAPKVTGGGGYADLIRAGLAKVTGAANAYGRKATAKYNASTSGGQSSAGGQYDKAALQALWTQAGGPAGAARIAAAIALAESGGNPNSYNPISDMGSHAEGLWQIEMPMNAADVPGGNAYNPLSNAQGAVRISGGGTNWNPWATYTSGAYRQFMARGGLVDLARRMARGGLVSFDSGMTIESDGIGPHYNDGSPSNHTAYADGRLNASKTSFTALFDGFRAAHGISFGDIENLHYGNKHAFGIVGDSAGGGSGIHGEGSIHMAQALGIPWSPATGGVSSGVHYVIAPGSHNKSHGSIDQHIIDRIGAQIFGTKQPHHSHGHPHKHKHGSGGGGHPKTPPNPRKGYPGGPAHGPGSGIESQYEWLTALLGAGSTNPNGVPMLSELLGYWPGIWALENPTATSIMGDPSAAIISTDSAGNPILPYLDAKDVAQARAWLEQQIGWEAGIVRDYTSAVPVSERLTTELRQRIAARKAKIEKIKDRIQKNLKRIRDLNKKIAHNNKWIARTQKLMQNVPAGTGPSQGAGATKPDTAKINKYKAHIKSLRGDIHGWSEQIHDYEHENQKLGGATTGVGSGGEIGQITNKIAPLQTMLSNVADPGGSFSQTSLTGVSGVAGLLGPEVTNLRTLQGELGALSPKHLAKLLADAQAQTGGSTSSTSTALLQQQELALRQELAVSQAQFRTLSGALGSLPPFGGSFASGGVVPGFPGEPRTIIAHGGERISPDGEPVVHVHISGKDKYLSDLIDVRVDQRTRAMARSAGRGLPGRGGGR